MERVVTSGPRVRWDRPPGSPGPRRSLDSSRFVPFDQRDAAAVNTASAPARGLQGRQQRSGHMSHNERTPGPWGASTPWHSKLSMRIQFHFTQSIPTATRLAIRAAVRRSMAKVSYPAPRLVDVVVVCDPKQSITHGHALYQHTVVLTLGHNDILMPDLRRLIAVFHHELSHVARIKSVGYGHTLGEAVVTEGIGIAVEEEFGGDIAQWAHFSGANHEKPTIQR